MLRTLFRRSLWMTGSLLVGLVLLADSSLACTASDAGTAASTALDSAEGGVVQMTPAARMSPTVGLGNTAGLKLRIGQTQSLTQRTPVLATSENTADSPTYKPLAMLAAAVALMVSIALRRSGKR